MGRGAVRAWATARTTASGEMARAGRARRRALDGGERVGVEARSASGVHACRRARPRRSALLPDRCRHRSRLDQGDVDAPRLDLDPQRIGEGLDGKLRCGVRADDRRGHPAGDRADIDDAPAAPPEQRQRCLRHRDEADHVHLELFSELGDREDLDGPRDDDAGIVDQARERRRRPASAATPARAAAMEFGSVTSRMTGVSRGEA